MLSWKNLDCAFSRQPNSSRNLRLAPLPHAGHAVALSEREDGTNR